MYYGKKELDKQDFKNCKSIHEQLSKIDGIKEIQFTKDSEISNIIAFAEWDESEIKKKLEEIYMIEHVDIVDTRELVPANAKHLNTVIQLLA